MQTKFPALHFDTSSIAERIAKNDIDSSFRLSQVSADSVLNIFIVRINKLIRSFFFSYRVVEKIVRMSFALRFSQKSAVALNSLHSILPRTSYSSSLLTEHRCTPKSYHAMPAISMISARHFSLQSTFAGIYSEISNSTCVHLCQQNLLNIHEYTGLPWWATIVVTTIALRSIITFPLAVYTNKINVRLEQINKEMPALVAELKEETARAKYLYKLSDRDTERLFKHNVNLQWNKLVVRENCHPFKMFVVLWTQIPLWICQSMAIRNMLNMLPDPKSFEAQITYTLLTVGGFGWMPDLTAVDSTLILPIVFGMLNLANIELAMLTKSAKPGRVQKIVMTFFRLLVIALVPVAASVPSCLTLYWTVSSAFSLAQNLLLVSPRAKRILRIPPTSKDHMETPYRTIAARFVECMQTRREFGLKLLRLKN